MVHEQHVTTLIHEIRELEAAIERFCADADEQSDEVVFDFAAITQWGHELAERLTILEAEDIPPPRSGYKAEDPAYRRALRDARAIHTDADNIEHELTVCLEAITAITDPASLWSAIGHLQAELEVLERSLDSFANRLRSSATFPSDY
jgi:hypothetical protein